MTKLEHSTQDAGGLNHLKRLTEMETSSKVVYAFFINSKFATGKRLLLYIYQLVLGLTYM